MDTTTTRRQWLVAGAASALIIVICAVLIYSQTASKRVAIDAAVIQAPTIDLSASQPGTLQEIYVHAGDQIAANTVVARVGNELVKAKVAGIVITIAQKIGTQVSAGQPVVEMIDPAQLRVVGKVDENKGLDRLQVGDSVVFTVDAFGGTKFSAVVDEIAPTSEQSGVVFNISDKREVKQFEIKARFDVASYPQLKNGMSARMWVYTT
jgi:multidrug resistance efflux pump